VQVLGTTAVGAMTDFERFSLECNVGDVMRVEIVIQGCEDP